MTIVLIEFDSIVCCSIVWWAMLLPHSARVLGLILSLDECTEFNFIYGYEKI